MIETVEGIKNADEILSVPGVDACFVGPNDLAASMGLPPSLDPRVPEFEQALDKILQACKRNGVAPGLHTPNAERCGDRIEQGWQLNAINSDGGFMAAAAGAAVKGVRERVGGAAADSGATRAGY
jgi:4-hydroxy-2-oxoheptanedioate aldolase